MRNKSLIIKAFTLVLLLFVLLSLNWDRVEMENRAYVIAIGIDKGENAAFLVHLSIMDVVALETGGEDAPKILHSAEGDSLAAALANAAKKIPDKPYFGHTKAIMLGSELLKNPALVSQTTDTLNRNPDININTMIAATKGSAGDVMTCEDTGKNLLKMYLSNNHNFTVQLDLEGLSAALRQAQSTLIPIISLENDESAEHGVAVIKNMTLAGFVKESDMAGYPWLTGDAAGVLVALKDGTASTLEVEKSRVKYTFKEKDGKLHVNAQITASGNIVGASLSPDPSKPLELNFSTKIQSYVEKTFRIFQNDFGIDALQLKDRLKKHEPALYEKYGKNWDDSLKKIIFTSNVELKINKY
ncbi:MAG: Ger(x)C family spore germination protein [Defluviitaleaceae bacterium]|nr:Ger(x)C family spore germination protein [Defluviitaleaceae bacterium]